MDRNAGADALLEALPYSKEAEQSVLGAIIADPARITDALELLQQLQPGDLLGADADVPRLGKD